MKREDWKCPVCGSMMFKSSSLYLTCEAEYALSFGGYYRPGMLYRAWHLKDLPFARRVGYRKFKIRGESGILEYVPHAHKRALEKAPDYGEVVAKGVGKRNSFARVFRKVTPKKSSAK